MRRSLISGALARTFFSAIICFCYMVSALPVLATPPDSQHEDKAHFQNSNNSQEENNGNGHSKYSIFAPKEQTNSAKLNYDIWSVALKQSVVKMGPSLRIRAQGKKPGIDSRIIKGNNKSPYRLEGSRIAFTYLPDKYIETLTIYRKDLAHFSNEHDLQSYSKNEQLAYWINLHNVLVIENIAKHYPIRKPSKIILGPDGQGLHDAKLVTINGVPLSLRDIREEIVYRYWSDPVVIYGFFRGDIGGPGIMDFAVTGDNVKHVLDLQAFEFITSLRGINRTRHNRNLSHLYAEARPYYFRNWPADLESHLRQYADEATMRDIDEDLPFRIEKYDESIADLWGGTASRGSGSVASLTGQNLGMPPLLYERARKIRMLRRRGKLKRTYSVTITDIETNPDVR